MYHQLTLTTNTHEVEPLSEQLTELGAVSITLQDAEDQPILEPSPGETPLWQAIKLTALFTEEQDLSLLAPYLKQAELIQLEDQDWERVWLKDFKPMAFGKRLWVCPSHVSPPEPDATNLMLDPGLAFGTGTHPTTALCLSWLDETIQGGELLIDYGCGSGILAIAALKLGAKHVEAIDNDPQALIASQENAKRNGIDPSTLNIYLPSEEPTQQADVLVANILAQPLLELGEHFLKQLKPGGRLALSGILENQAELIKISYQALGFLLEDAVILDGWALIHGRKHHI